jgi:hypothetical protein
MTSRRQDKIHRLTVNLVTQCYGWAPNAVCIPETAAKPAMRPPTKAECEWMMEQLRRLEDEDE